MMAASLFSLLVFLFLCVTGGGLVYIASWGGGGAGN
jgi:hypothetical protein